MKGTYSLIILGVFFMSSLFAQEKLWEKNLKTELYEVGWIQQANSGTIIAAGAKGLLGIDHVSGETLWHNKELKGINKNSFFNIEGLPLFYVEYVPVIGKFRGIIVNSSNGDIVFDTKDEGYRIKNYTTLTQEGIILFELLKAKERILMNFSLKTWQKKWHCSLGEVGGVLSKIFSGSFIDHGPYFNKSGDLLVGVKEHIYAINIETGKIIWKHETDKKVKALVYSKINNSLYVGVKKSKKLIVLDPDKGNDITPGKLKLRGTLIDIVSDVDNNLILVETEGFNIIDPKTNTFKWKKSFKIPYLDEVIPHEKGFIAIGKDEKDGSSVALVDKQGGKIWDTNVKGYAYFAVPMPKGVFYISTERSNILEYEKGKDVWKKDVKFKSIPAVTFDEKEDKVILFENKKGYKFDLKTGAVDLFAQDVVLEKVNKKTALVAEYIEGSGYLIHGDQYISLLTPSGKVDYTKYYKPATDIAGLAGVAQLGLAIAGVDLDIEGALSNIDELKRFSANANGVYRGSADQTDGTVEENVVAGLYVGPDAQNMSTIFEVTKKRYSNSKDIKDHKFIVAKVKSETEPTFHKILMVNKKTGKEDAQIKLIDKTPNYVIDEIDSVVFVNEKNYLISAHKF